MKKRKIIVGSVITVIAAGVLLCFCYLNDYYHADETAIESFETENEVTVEVLEDNTIVCKPEESEAALIFYPGGKVEHTAYIPLMKACASKGIMSILVEMPFRLAVLDTDAAEGYQEQYPEIEKWYIGGHSLGGSMAASYLEENAEDFEGLILLGSYSIANLSNSSLEVMSIYGSEDEVLNSEKYMENRDNLPNDFDEEILEGGCHAYFGMYGEQEGDGEAFISNEEQINLTTELIATFIRE